MESESSQNKIIEKKQPFFKKYKKEIIIIFFAILVFVLLVYFLFFNKKESLNNSNFNNPTLSTFSFNNLLNNIFNNNDNNSSSTKNNENTGDEDLGEYYIEKLIKIWDKPVAGYGFYNKDYVYEYQDELGETQKEILKKTILQFVDSETGYIYEKDLSDPKSIPSQISKNSYPNIVKAYFINNSLGGKGRVILQYSSGDIIKTISATIPSSSSQPLNLLNIISLPDNIKNINYSPDNKKLVFTVVKSVNKGDFTDVYSDWYYIDNVDNLYGKRIYTSLFSFWKLIVLNSGEIYAYNTDSSYSKNNLYKLNSSVSSLGYLSLVYGPHFGMSFDIIKNKLLMSLYSANGIQLYKKDFSGEPFSDTDLYKLNFSTLSNKCTQSEHENTGLIICSVPKGIKNNYDYNLPDAWYQGMTTWDDNLYVVSADYPTGQLLFDIHNDSSYQDKIDGKTLKITPDNRHLVFINKLDGSLWTLNIENILSGEEGD